MGSPPKSRSPDTDSRTDGDLLDAWRCGDASAGEVLFVRHFATVGRFFRNKVAADRVADLIQETFTAAVEGRDRILDSSRFRAYLLSIAYYVFCKYLRDSYRRIPNVDLDEISVDALGPTPSVLLAKHQEQRLLLEGLRAIAVNYQVVLELHYWEGLTTSQIAEVLGVPNGTVRSRLQRARDALEAAMASIARSPEVLESTLTRLEDWARRCSEELRVSPAPGTAS
jgi:RNA polymerase sigma-70 factor (ECF subfamily)